MFRHLWTCSLTLAIAISAASARADIAVSIGDLTLAPGGTGTLDVYGTTDAVGGSLNNLALTLQISGGGLVFFSPSQPTDYLYPAVDPSYILSASTSGSDRSSSQPGSPDEGINNPSPFTQISIADFTNFDPPGNFNAPAVTLAASTRYLLARIAVTASDIAATDLYTVSLVDSSGGSFNGGSASTFFNVQDADFNEQSFIPYTSTSGTVTVSAIPEPSSLMLASFAGVVILVRRRRHQIGREAD